MSLRFALLAAAFALCACASQSSLPAAPLAFGPRITVAAKAVPLSAIQHDLTRMGAFSYAGGLALTAPDTSRLHGLSDLKIRPDGRLLAVSDNGEFVEAHLQLDAAGRLIGVTDAALSPLLGEDGRDLALGGKSAADAEGFAELADGSRLVSLETDDRILLYPPDGGRPRRVAAPQATFPSNSGMEALSEDPAAGPDAYIVGGEVSGQTWLCRLAAGCRETARVPLPEDGGLTAVAPLPDGGRAYLVRAFSMLKGVRISLRITGPDGALRDELKLAAPLTVDNFEGLAAAPQPDGAIRFYLLSDDNFSGLQKTLLLAFDWEPPPPKAAGGGPPGGHRAVEGASRREDLPD